MTTLEQQAHNLACQPYHRVATREKLEDGQEVYVLSLLELPGCIAQGNTLPEALADLSEVVYEYILGYLEDGVPVPQPYAETIETAGGTVIDIGIRLPHIAMQESESDFSGVSEFSEQSEYPASTQISGVA